MFRLNFPVYRLPQLPIEKPKKNYTVAFGIMWILSIEESHLVSTKLKSLHLVLERFTISKSNNHEPGFQEKITKEKEGN